MTPEAIGEVVATAWERAMTLGGYGYAPLTIAWFRGEAFVRMWNYRTGTEEWRPFRTSRPEAPNPRRSPFDAFDGDSWLYRTLNRG